MARKTTIADVALLADVSVATVDRVLNGRGGVASEKARRVLSAAKRLRINRVLPRSHARTLRVAVLIQSAANPFHAVLGDALATAGRRYADLNLQVLINHIDPNDARRTAVAIDSLARQHDGLIISSPCHTEVAGALRRAAATIPIVTLATDIPDSGRHAYVGPDDWRAGRVAGDLMGRFLGTDGGEILMIAGLSSIVGHREREGGFRAVLREHHPACSVTSVVESREEPNRAGEVALAALRGNARLRGIYHASAGAGAVVDAVNVAGRRDIVMITHELTEDRRSLLRARAIHAVVDQNPTAEAMVAIETMARLLGRLDGDVITTLTPTQIYTAENA